jgi:hypothetical protein
MNDLPLFEEAVSMFQRFLTEQRHPVSVQWLFRQDLLRRSRYRVFVRTPPYVANAEPAKKVFCEGRTRGLVEIVALAKTERNVVATVWYPKLPGEEVEGWDTGLKVSIAEPLPTAMAVSAAVWPVLQCTPWYRRYEASEVFVGTREWAAAYQGH